MAVLNIPAPAWMSEDLVLLADSAAKFFGRECAPHYDEWEKRGSVGRETWEKAGAAGLLGASVPEEYGGAGGSFAHDAIITYQANLAGIDAASPIVTALSANAVTMKSGIKQCE